MSKWVHFLAAAGSRGSISRAKIYCVDLPFCFELYQKSFQVLKTRVMLRADGNLSYDARRQKCTTNGVCKGREMERKKTIVVIRLHSDELEKFWQGLRGFHLDAGFV